MTTPTELDSVHPARPVLLRKPVFRTNAGERKATWIELFYDLAFVLAVASLAHALSSESSLRALLEFGLVFLLLQWAWVGYTFYNDRFDTDDLLHRLLAVLQMGPVLFIGSLHDWLEEDFTAFVLAYGLIRLITIGANVWAGLHVKPARRLTATLSVGFALALLPLVAAVWVETPQTRLILVAIAAIAQLLPPLLPTHDPSAVPLSGTHLPERLGLFVTLVLGESLAALVHGAARSHHEPLVMLAFAEGLGIAFCTWWIYFACVDGSVVARPSVRAAGWIYAHLPLTFFLVLLAVGIGENIGWLIEPAPGFRNRMLHLAWSGTLVSLAVVTALSEQPLGGRTRRHALISLELLFAVLALVYAFLNTQAVPLLKISSVLAMAGILLVASLPLEARRSNHGH